jgi:hypothetical protein
MLHALGLGCKNVVPVSRTTTTLVVGPHVRLLTSALLSSSSVYLFTSWNLVQTPQTPNQLALDLSAGPFFIDHSA